MRKVLVLLVFVCLATTFGIKRSENWIPKNLVITSNKTVTLPYSRTGFFVKSLDGTTVVVVHTKAGVTATDNVLGYSWFDYYPNAYMNITSDNIKLTVSSGTANVYYETYELNE